MIRRPSPGVTARKSNSAGKAFTNQRKLFLGYYQVIPVFIFREPALPAVGCGRWISMPDTRQPSLPSATPILQDFPSSPAFAQIHSPGWGGAMRRSGLPGRFARQATPANHTQSHRLSNPALAPVAPLTCNFAFIPSPRPAAASVGKDAWTPVSLGVLAPLRENSALAASTQPHPSHSLLYPAPLAAPRPSPLAVLPNEPETHTSAVKSICCRATTHPADTASPERRPFLQAQWASGLHDPGLKLPNEPKTFLNPVEPTCYGHARGPAAPAALERRRIHSTAPTTAKHELPNEPKTTLNRPFPITSGRPPALGPTAKRGPRP
jgi:hypothetical protein